MAYGSPERDPGGKGLSCRVAWKRFEEQPWRGRRRHPVRVPSPRFLATALTRAATLGVLVFMVLLLGPGPVGGAPISVRFVEGATRGFLMLHSVNGVLSAQGDLFQSVQGGEVKSRMVFRFKDGSLFDETVVFTQQRVFTMQTYHLVQRGPTFGENSEISLTRSSGKYRVKIQPSTGAEEKVLEGILDLPPDVYNGMVLMVTRNLPKGAKETIHTVAFTPTPRLIQLEMTLAGEQKVLVGELAKTATHYVLKPRLGIWLKFFATLLGRVPGDYHAWFLMDEVPAFVRFEGPLQTTGPIWRIELTSPRWPD